MYKRRGIITMLNNLIDLDNMDDNQPLPEKETQNCSANLKYLIQCVFPSRKFPTNPVDPKETLPDLTISRSTLNNAKRGSSISVRTARKITVAFSSHYTGSKGGIKLEDISSAPEEFKINFPANAFKLKEDDKPSTNIALFTNKLYRGYYMLRNSSYKSCMAYFWIFSEDGKCSAAMLRGISDFKDVAQFFDYENEAYSSDSKKKYSDMCKFENISEIKKCFKDFKHRNVNNKRTSSIHLYLAERDNIRYSPSCIQINFHTEEVVSCYSTMYWNIDIASISKQSPYIGGSVLMVDTNEGIRGKDICAFKLGLECVDTLKNKLPLNNTAPQVIAELMPKTKNGVLLIDNADDANWYRFISEDTFRGDSSGAVLDERQIYQIISRLANLEKDYELRLSEANDLVNKLKTKTESSASQKDEGIDNKYKSK